MKKLKLKALARKIEAAEAGHLLPHELSAKLRNDVKEVAKRRSVNDKRIVYASRIPASPFRSPFHES